MWLSAVVALFNVIGTCIVSHTPRVKYYLSGIGVVLWNGNVWYG